MNRAVSKFSVSALFTALASVIALGGCVSVPPPIKATDVPAGWEGPLKAEAPIWPQKDWWNTFGDAELSQLIATVQTNNLDLANVNRNLQSAQIALKEAGYNLLPTPVVTIGTGAALVSETHNNNVGLLGPNTNPPNTPVTATAGFTYNDILSKPANYEKAKADYTGQIGRAHV